LRIVRTAGSPKPRSADNKAKAVPTRKMYIREALKWMTGIVPGRQ
jgi:hypothetical protein